jgi:hypothetical protein
MQASENPFASDATQRVPLNYENLKMLERECFVTEEERKTLLLFCGWYPSLVLTHHSDFSLCYHTYTAGATIPTPLGFAYEYTLDLLMNVQRALRDLLDRKEKAIADLDEEALMSARKLEAALIRNPNLPEDDEARFFFKICNCGERRLLRRTWTEQRDFVIEILGAFADEDLEDS